MDEGRAFNKEEKVTRIQKYIVKSLDKAPSNSSQKTQT